MIIRLPNSLNPENGLELKPYLSNLGSLICDSCLLCCSSAGGKTEWFVPGHIYQQYINVSVEVLVNVIVSQVLKKCDWYVNQWSFLQKICQKPGKAKRRRRWFICPAHYICQKYNNMVTFTKKAEFSLKTLKVFIINQIFFLLTLSVLFLTFYQLIYSKHLKIKIK